ncbi:MAG: flagellar hook-associated protein FlgL [Deltaproteobacteria bacterium]|nr:flagellar hook-associated protein FlgL [Deltaproteobacteria bacterium]
MRITQSITYNKYINDIMRNQESLYKLNQELSTGRKVNAPSDDPVNASRILTGKSVLSEFNQYEKNIDYGLTYLNEAEHTLQGAKDIITKIQELAVSESNGTASAFSRANTAKVVSGLYDQLISMGNTSFDNRYIFSGFKTGTPAFSPTGAYQGDANKYAVKINSNTTVTLGVNGGEVFKGTAGGVDVFQSISDLVTALNANNSTGVQASLDTLEASYKQVSEAVSTVGGRITRLNAVQTDISNSKIDLKTTISSIEDADMASVISELKLGQIALEASITSAGKVFSINIFNYL